MNYLFPFIAACIWGGNAIVTKASAGLIAPFEIAFYRWVLALLILTPLAGRGAWANRRLIGGQIARLAGLGALGFVLFPSFLYFAAQYTSAIHIGIIQALMPLISIALSVALLGHRLTRGAALGGVISLAGVSVVVSHGDPAHLLRHGLNRGDALMLAASLCYASYTVLLRRWQSGLPMLQALYVQGAAATLMLLPLFLLTHRHGITAANAPLIVYAGAMASIVAPLVWMHGIARIGPARASLFFNLIPVITAGLAVGLLGEEIGLGLLLGGAMVIGGVVLAELWRTPFSRRANTLSRR